MVEQLMNLAPILGPWNPAMLVLAMGIFVVTVGAVQPKVLVFGSLACYSLIMVDPAVLAIPGIIDLRVVAIGMAVYLAMLRGRLPRFHDLRRGAFPATLLFLVFGLALLPWSQDPSLAWGDLLTAVFCTSFAWILIGASTESELRSAVWTVALLMTVMSLLYVLAGGSAGIVQGRWKGVTGNANTLGLFAAIFFITSKRRDRIWALLLVITVFLGSASRAPAFALGLVAGPKLLEGASTWVRRSALVVALILAVPVVHSVFFSSADATGTEEKTLTRTQNSRAEEWGDGLRIMNEHPLTGVGVGNQPSLVSSSVVSPLTQIGLWALIPLGLIAGLAIRRIRAPETAFRALFVMLCIHGIFEMWLFAGGSAFFLIFLIAAYDPGLVAAQERGEEPADPDVFDLAGSPP